MAFNPTTHHSTSVPNGTRTTKTTVREFNEKGECVKETTTEVTETTYAYQPNVTYTQQQYPLIRNTATFGSGGGYIAPVDTPVQPTTLHSSKRARQQQKDVDI